MSCGAPADYRFFSDAFGTFFVPCTLLMHLRRSFRLIGASRWLELRLRHQKFTSPLTHVNVHRLKETINGREYLIEVSNVGVNKWRAQIRRTPGGCCAMMPFYGDTPEEAARQLSRWLTIVNAQRREPTAAAHS
jgi:hypothetical protein